MKIFKILFATIMLGSFAMGALAEKTAQCPDFLNQEFKRLHSSETLNLCSLYEGKPMLLVNTASHCGYTKQFKPLEALYQKYKSAGLQVVGFASDDFNQEAKSEKEAATICYENYGVSFTMLAPSKVKGDEANAVFRHLAQTSGKQPSWNFNKYLVSADGSEVQHFGSNARPLGGKLEKAVKEAL